MVGRAVSGFMVTLLLLSMLVLLYNIQPVRAYEGLEVEVIPEYPGTNDLVNVTVSFTFCTMPPTVKEFGPIRRVGNSLLIDATVLNPGPYDYVLMVVHTDSYEYSLGNLLAGQYEFKVYVNWTINGEDYWDYRLEETKTFEVYDITVPDDYPTIQEAVNAASDGDTVFVRSGIYYGRRNPAATLVVVNKSISLIGENKSDTILDGYENRCDRIIHIAADNVTVRGFTIQNVGSIWGDFGGGIFIAECNGNRIVDNIIKNPYALGINLWSTNDTQITDNIFIDNGNAIYCRPYSRNNIIYHNNFIKSVSHIFIVHSSNTWDNGYPAGGNYWDDYNGTDCYSGVYQNETGSDGIGDTPYVYDEDNIDRYPLMRPWKWPLLGETNHDFKVDMRDIGAAARAFGSYPGHAKWNVLADLTGPEYLVPDGEVDMRDIGLIARRFGQTYP